MQMVNTFSLSVSAATFPNPTYKNKLFFSLRTKAADVCLIIKLFQSLKWKEN